MDTLTKHCHFTMKKYYQIINYAWSSRRAWSYTASCRSRERFARTTLGSLWLGIANIISITVLSMVYGRILGEDSLKTYYIYLALGVSLWTSLSSAILSSSVLLKVHYSNIKNSTIPIVYYSLEEWWFQVLTLCHSALPVLVVLTILDFSTMVNLMTYGLLPVLNFLVFIYWFPVLVTICSAFYDDINQLVPVFLQFSFLASPIMYQQSSLGSVSWITNLNPLYFLIKIVREASMSRVIDVPVQIMLLLANTTLAIIVSNVLLKRSSQIALIL